MVRSKLISDLVNKILCLKIDHPLRVGVSGITASGKTTIANELAEELICRKKNVIRTSIDHFHNPREIRYKLGKESALGYYESAHDYESFKHKLLIPLGPNGNLHYQTISLDLHKDEYVNSDLEVATKDMIFIIDGTFLFKRDLCNLYDFKIFVDTDFDIARKRGAIREERAFGSYEKAEEMFIKRYHAASKLYLEQHSPQLNADVVIRNNDLNNPVLYFNNKL
ncbi:uridine kinase [Gottfriedia acidiceleris]|uniref:uridine kinase n=1 Tax=Gottfriedia acidiceleris TaxID=371036 RepID=UPI000B42FCB6|nr:uridine kinase [Gottfriedia acidiceleris]